MKSLGCTPACVIHTFALFNPLLMLTLSTLLAFRNLFIGRQVIQGHKLILFQMDWLPQTPGSASTHSFGKVTLFAGYPGSGVEYLVPPAEQYRVVPNLHDKNFVTFGGR